MKISVPIYLLHTVRYSIFEVYELKTPLNVTYNIGKRHEHNIEHSIFVHYDLEIIYLIIAKYLFIMD